MKIVVNVHNNVNACPCMTFNHVFHRWILSLLLFMCTNLCMATNSQTHWLCPFWRVLAIKFAVRDSKSLLLVPHRNVCTQLAVINLLEKPFVLSICLYLVFTCELRELTNINVCMCRKQSWVELVHWSKDWDIKINIISPLHIELSPLVYECT